MTWKCSGEEQHADVLLFQRVSSTGTVACLYPLNPPSLLSLANMLISCSYSREDKLCISEVLVICTFFFFILLYLFHNVSCMFCYCCNNLKHEVGQSYSGVNCHFRSWTSSDELTNRLIKKKKKRNIIFSIIFSSALKTLPCEGLYFTGRQV